MKPFLSLSGIAAVVFLLSGCPVPTDNTIVSDDFNRADSFTVGNSWVESEPGDPGTVATASIIGNKLVCQGGMGSSVYFGTVYQANLAFSNHKTTLNFSMDNNGYTAVQLYDSTTVGSNFYQIQIGSNGGGGGTISLYKIQGASATTLASTSFAFNPAHNYTLTESCSNSTFTIDIKDLTTSVDTQLPATTDNTFQLFGVICIGGGNFASMTAYKTYIDSVLLEKL